MTKNSSGTVRLKSALGWVSFKPHLVKKLNADYKPDSSDLEKVKEALERAIGLYSSMDDERQLEVEGE